MPGAKVDNETQESAGKKKWIRASTVFLVLSLLMAIGGGLVLAIDREVPPLIAYIKKADIPEPGWLGLFLLVSGLFLANLIRMLQIWRRLKEVLRTTPSKRNKDQRAIAHNGFRELFVYLFAALSSLTAIVYLSAGGFLPWKDLGLDGVGQSHIRSGHVAVLLSVLLLALIPPTSGFFLQVRLETSEIARRKLLRDDVISPASFWLSALLIGGIVALAAWAGRVSSLPEDASLVINLCVMFGVVATFVGFIFIPHIARYINGISIRSADSPQYAGASVFPLAAPAKMASHVDSILVRLIAPLTGATQKGPGIPHTFVLLTLLPLTALGFVLAPPYGLLPISIGALMIIALGRRWAWIEEDRETASRLLKTDSPEIQVGFDNDLKDEALLGYAMLFIFVPLALYQINGSAGVFEIKEAENPFIAWLAFFGAELAKAVPFVDWWEIYNVDLNSPVEGVLVSVGDQQTTAPLAKHLTFAARAMVDLVIMAALLQAIGIWQRTRTQKHLFEIGHVNHFDPFSEQDFFENAFASGAQAPKPDFAEKIRKHINARRDLKLPGEPYNPERLADLLKSENQDIQRTALWMVKEYQILTGTPKEKLKQLRSQWLNISFPQLSAAGTPDSRKRLLDEKYKFEQLIAEFSDIRSEIRKDDVGLLLALLEDVYQIPEFAFSQLETVWLLGQLPSEYAFLGLAAHVLPDDQHDWRGRIVQKFGRLPRLRFSQAPLRAKVYESIEAIGLDDGLSDTIACKVLAYLDLLSDPAIEGANSSASRAAAAAARIREAKPGLNC